MIVTPCPFTKIIFSLSNSVYYANPPHFERVALGATFESAGVYTNHWGLAVTNQMIFALIDNGQLVDFVSFANLGYYFDISEVLNEPMHGNNASLNGIWSIKPMNGITEGVYNQINYSLELRPDDTTWRVDIVAAKRC